MPLNLPFEVLFILYRLNQAGFEAYIVGGAVRDLILQSLLADPAASSIPTNLQVVADYDFATNAQPAQIQELLTGSYYENDFGMVAISHEKLLTFIKERELLIPEQNMQQQFERLQPKKGKRIIDLSTATKLHTSLQAESTKNEDRSAEAASALATATAKIHDFEITTYRSDGLYEDYRHPAEVIWGQSIEEDLVRRDFTINAMAIKVDSIWLADIFQPQEPASIKLQNNYLLSHKNYQLIDLHHGMQDLTKKKLVTVGAADERFKEDALRMLRAIRFAVQLEMTLDSELLAAIKKNAQLLKHVSWERIRDEFLKMLVSPSPKKALLWLDETGLLELILPELQTGKGVNQGGHHNTDVWQHSLDAVKACPSRSPIVRLATLLHDIGKPQTQRVINGQITFYNHEIVGSRMATQIGKRFKLSKKQLQILFTLVRYHMFYYQPELTDAAIRRMMRHVGLEMLDDILDLREGDRLGSGASKTSWRLEELKQRMIDQLHQPMAIADMAIDGNDLMQTFGLKPGPQLGKILQALFEQVLEKPELNNKEILRELACDCIKKIA